MKYPFEFNELLLTDQLLKTLGGTRAPLNVTDSIFTFNFPFQLALLGETNEENGNPRYITQHFVSCITYKPIYFLHELWDEVTEKTPEIVLFTAILKKNNLWEYIESYLEYKDIMSKFEGK